MGGKVGVLGRIGRRGVRQMGEERGGGRMGCEGGGGMRTWGEDGLKGGRGMRDGWV